MCLRWHRFAEVSFMLSHCMREERGFVNSRVMRAIRVQLMLSQHNHHCRHVQQCGSGIKPPTCVLFPAITDSRNHNFGRARCSVLLAFIGTSFFLARNRRLMCRRGMR